MIFMRMDLYPPIAPFAMQHLPVGGRHSLYVEQCGNQTGFPALFLHGGPGSHSRAVHRQFFDPRFYRAVLFDQRGCGRSKPRGCTEENTTHHLVEDIETLRRHFALERLLLFGGSWGATLALAYACEHPDRVAAMVLRGVFLGTRAEVDAYLNGLRGREGAHPLARYHALVNQSDEAAASAGAQRWLDYEEAVMNVGRAQQTAASARGAPSSPEERAAALARARVQLHYLAHDCFLEPGKLLSRLGALASTPVIIVQGERDTICPPRAARELAARLPCAELRPVPDGGHVAEEPAIAQALRRATDELRERL